MSTDTHPAAAPLMLSVSGCRGIFGKTMTPVVAARFAGVFGSYLREREPGTRPLVVLGRDGRAGGGVLLDAAAAGLAAAGCDALILGVAMTPTIGVMVDARRAAGGLVVTASHNPQEWNGLKPIIRAADAKRSVDASAPGKDLADILISRYNAACAVPGGAQGVGPTEIGTVSHAAPPALDIPSEPTNIHLEVVKSAMKAIGAHDDRASMAVRCVLDSVNASGREAGAALLGTRLVQHVGAGTSGLFPHPPEPTRENLVSLSRFVTDKKAAVGFAQDPDADRLAILDEHGRYIGEEYTLVLAAEAVLGATGSSSSAPTICVNLSTSRMIEDVAAKYAGRVIRTAVGEANVVSAMKQHDAVFGGEGNGGVIWPRVTYIRDSLSAMALIIALVARTGKTVSQLVADVPSYAIVKRKVDLRAKEDAARAVEALAKAYATERVDRQDGVWVGFDAKRAWLHVRASNTEPIMRLIAEAPTEAQANAILDEAARVIGPNAG
jgi:phosphomannomutase